MAGGQALSSLSGEPRAGGVYNLVKSVAPKVPATTTSDPRRQADEPRHALPAWDCGTCRSRAHGTKDMECVLRSYLLYDDCGGCQLPTRVNLDNPTHYQGVKRKSPRLQPPGPPVTPCSCWAAAAPPLAGSHRCAELGPRVSSRTSSRRRSTPAAPHLLICYSSQASTPLPHPPNA